MEIYYSFMGILYERNMQRTCKENDLRHILTRCCRATSGWRHIFEPPSVKQDNIIWMIAVCSYDVTDMPEQL